MNFETGRLEIGHNADAWGPFGFEFSDGLPSGITVTAVTCRSFLGRVQPKDDLTDETETTSELIDNALIVSNTIVQVYFNLPSTTAYRDANHTLVFEFTTDNVLTGTHSAYFYRVVVVKEA